MTLRFARLVLLVLGAVAAARPGPPIAAQAVGPHVVKVVGDRHQLALKSDGRWSGRGHGGSAS